MPFSAPNVALVLTLWRALVAGAGTRLARWPLALGALVLHMLLLVTTGAQAGPPVTAGFSVDPATVQRHRTGAYEGWRYPQAGWTVVHLEGPPYQRGVQHGHLLAAETVAYIRALSEFWDPRAPAAAWAHNRRVSRALFLSGFTPEQRREMQGVADGASDAGARIDDGAGRLRRLDELDIVTINASNEIDALPDALSNALPAQALPRALWPRTRATPASQTRGGAHPQRQRPQRCNAFIANGPATADGRIVAGHITMYDLYPANFYNVWMEVVPTEGYRFVMQTTPGGMHSGMDYAINAAGLLLAETTLDQGPWVPGGTPLAARIRLAQQYADGIERAAELLTRGDNGLCSTEWVMGDLRRNEIALLTLAGAQTRLRRGSRGEWVAGTEGFFWSDNNIKEPGARLQAGARRDGRPSAAAVYAPSKRDAVWLRAYREHKGRMDQDFARRLLTTPEIVSAYGVDAKYTDATLAARLQSWGAFGPPVGDIWLPSAQEAREHAAIRPLIHNPWTLLEVQPPPPASADAAPVADRPDARQRPPGFAPPPAEPPAAPRWRGTLRPASDADIWLSSAFAEFERVLADQPPAGSPAAARAPAQDALAVELAYYRALYHLSARAGVERPLAQTRADMGDPLGHRVALAKGVLLLAALRDLMGHAAFERAMRDFGQRHDGQAVGSAQLQAFLQARSAQPLAPVFERWTQHTGLPRALPRGAVSRAVASGWETELTLDGDALGAPLALPLTLETAGGGVLTRWVTVSPAQPVARLHSAARPLRVLIDAHGVSALGNTAPYTILTLDDEPERTLIVYGTLDEAVGNREAARALQTALRRREHNVQPALKADHELTEADAATHHLLLIGRPATNAVAARLAGQWPLRFGPASFAVQGQVYADAGSAVLVAAENPANPRYSVVLVAGLGALSTWQAAQRFADEQLGYAPLVVLRAGRAPIESVPPLPVQVVLPRHE